MAYTKTTWRNNQSPAINADNLNHIEQGVYEAHQDIAENTQNIENLTTQTGANTSAIALEKTQRQQADTAETLARENADNLLSARMDTFTQLPSGSTSGDAELIDIRVGADGVTYPTAGDAVRGQVTDLKSDIDEILESSVIAYDTLEPYLYKKNTYINSSGVDTTLSGYDTYKIPLNDFDVLHISWDAEFWTGLSTGYIANVEFSDSSRLAIFNLGNLSYANFVAVYSEGIVLGAIPDLSDVKALYFTVKSNLVNNVHIAINKPYVQYVYDAKKIIELDSDNSIQSGIYYGDSGFSTFSSPYFTNWVKFNKGDRIDINKTVTGVNGKAMVIDSSGNISRLTTGSYIATDVSILCIFNNSNISGDITFTPALNTEIVDDGKQLKFIAGVIRNSGDGWEYINDSGHEPLNLTSVSVDENGRIEIDYGFTASKVLSLVATPDETFAGLYSIGGSVGLDKTLFNVYALPKIYGGMVRVTSGVFDATSYASFSSVAVQANGEIRLYHPSLSGLLAKEIFNIQASSPSYAIKLGSQGYDYVSLYAYDSNGQKITDFTGLSFDIYATRNVNARFVNANDIVDAGGNFWIYGVMEI